MAEWLNDSLFLKACKREQTSRPPIWLMRQAGRYMASYRALRARYSLLEMVKTPELAVQVTLQPLDAFQPDAAIIFADILTLLETMGLSLEFRQGEGPHIHHPLREAKDVHQLRVTHPEETLDFTLKAIELLQPELYKRKTPLIGFSGAPFTLASYAIEGGASKEYRLTKGLMRTEPLLWQELMNKLSDMIIAYMLAQVKAGAHALQLFDSWVGALSPDEFRRHVLPYLQKITQGIKEKSHVPLIYFGTQTSTLLKDLKSLAVDVIGIDWRIGVSTAWPLIGPRMAIQGNLDPTFLDAPPSVIQQEVDRILAEVQSYQPHRTGFIFNLGHGILQHTPEANVQFLVNHIKGLA